MTAKPLFHQQFYRAYFLLFLSLTFLLTAIFGLVTVREHDFDLQINAQLPQLEKNQQQLLSLKKAQSHINILSSSLTGDDLIEQHNQLEISLERVLANHSQLVLPNFVYLSKKNDAEKIIRLAGQDTINRRLITEVEEQLIQVLVPFKRLIELKQKRAEELFNLIKNDSVSGGATLSRAKAHAKLIMSISDERLAYEQLLQLIAQIPLLNLQSEEKLLENISQTANDFIGWFETAGNSIANEDPVLFKQMSSWKSLLINEDKFIDKWRVHAQRYDDYRSLLKQQQRYLSELANDIEKAKNKVASPLSVDELLPVWLQENLKRANIILDHQSLHFILLITIMLSLTMFLLVILNLNKRLQESSYHNVKLIESVLHQKEYEQSTYIEQDKIIALLNVIKHPPENQIDIDALINLHKVSINNIATFHRVISWDQTDVQSYQRLNTLFSNLFHLPNSKSFRANFTAESFQLLVQSARLAKETGKLIDCTLEAMLGNKYVCTLNFAGGFYGTVSPLHVDEEIIDIDADENLTQTLVELNENNAKEKTEIALALTDKVVKAMLQSQAECLTKKVPVSSLYRQLQRILILGQEITLKTQLTNSTYQLSSQATCLQSQIISCFSNLFNETKGHKNRVQYCDNLPAPCLVNIDTSVFNSAVMLIARLMLSGKRNAQLLLTTTLAEQNEEQDIVHYQFSLCLDKGLKEVPQELVTLVDALSGHFLRTDSSNTSDVMQITLAALHASEVTLVSDEQGYSLSFDLPHVQTKDRVLPQPPLFHDKTFLYVQTDRESFQYKQSVNVIDNVISQALSQTHASINTQIKLTEVLNYLTAESLAKTPIDMVIIESGTDIHEISERIASLPDVFQPKLHILADAPEIQHKTYLGKNSQQAWPFDKYALFENIDTLLSSTSTANEYGLAINDCYLPTGIEVLLAVSAIDNYSVLVNMLNAMGFNITYVASDVEMLTLWETGRHLILISAFELSPIIELKNGKQVQRGIVGISAGAVKQWKEQAVQKQWQISTLAIDFTFESLVELFSTWLVKKEKRPLIHRNEVPMTPPLDVNNVELKHAVKPIDFDELPAAFNLQSFADNQAGPEFAVMMIDEYLDDNSQLAHKLNHALSVQSSEEAISHLNQLMLNANIMSADNLLGASQQLYLAIEAQNYPLAKTLFPALKEQIELVSQYAEAI